MTDHRQLQCLFFREFEVLFILLKRYFKSSIPGILPLKTIDDPAKIEKNVFI